MDPITLSALISGGAQLAAPLVQRLVGGTPAQQPQTVNRYGTQGQEALNALFSSGTNALKNPTQGFEPFAQQARSEFFGKSLPGLAERFSRYPGQQSSSAYRNALSSAAGEFEQGLASAASQYGLQNRQQGVQELLAGLTPQFLAQLTPEKQGLIEQLLPSFIESVPGLVNSIGGLSSNNNMSELLKVLRFYLGGGKQQAQEATERANAINQGGGLLNKSQQDVSAYRRDQVPTALEQVKNIPSSLYNAYKWFDQPSTPQRQYFKNGIAPYSANRGV